MRLTLHLPRESEAKIKPALQGDLTIEPVFYKKQGWVNVIYVTTHDAKGRTEQHVISINAGNKGLKIEKLVAVVPACDTDEPTKDDDNANSSGQSSDSLAQDKDVR